MYRISPTATEKLDHADLSMMEVVIYFAMQSVDRREGFCIRSHDVGGTGADADPNSTGVMLKMMKMVTLPAN